MGAAESHGPEAHPPICPSGGWRWGPEAAAHAPVLCSVFRCRRPCPCPCPQPAFQLRSTLGGSLRGCRAQAGPCLRPDPALSPRRLALGSGASLATSPVALNQFGWAPLPRGPGSQPCCHVALSQPPPPAWRECACVRAELLFHIANINKGRLFTTLDGQTLSSGM